MTPTDPIAVQESRSEPVAEPDFGAHLRQARERRGMSLRQIAGTTKISMTALQALERNDPSRLPGGIFSRAFVRSYASEVGLDPEETVREFLAAFPVAGKPPSLHSSDAEPEEMFENKQRLASTFLGLALTSIPIVALLLYFTMSGGSERSSPPPEPVPAASETATTGRTAPEAAVSGSARMTVPAAATADASKNPAPALSPDVLTIELRPAAECWIAATVDGQRLTPRLFLRGEREVHRVRDEMVLLIGDASAFAFAINNEPGRTLGGAGQVVTARINRQNYTTYLRR